MKTKQKDQFETYRQELKGIYIVTSSPASHTVLAKAENYQMLEKIIKQKGLSDGEIAIQYLEPKRAICAYGISLFKKKD